MSQISDSLKDASSQTPEVAIPSIATRGMIIVLSIVALAIAVYLYATSLSESGTPLGCGEGGGCAEVLTSRWSQVFGIPVSVPAALIYMAIIAVMLILPVAGNDSRKLTWIAACTLGMLVILGAIWFVGLQVIHLNAICPWCMTEHGLGILIGLLILLSAAKAFGAKPIGVAFPIAAVLLAGLISAQSFGKFTGPEAERLSASQSDSDEGIGTSRRIKVLDGKLDLPVAEVPLVGSPDAIHLVVILFDYCCPHCRATHGYLLNALEKYPDQLAMILLPMPLNTDCNPHWKKTEDRFKESCELARLALAVWAVDQSQFKTFDQWLFETPKPRPLADAQLMAYKLVGEDKIKQALGNNPWINQLIETNVNFYAESGAERIPVLLSPGFSSIVGRPGSEEELMTILETDLKLTSSDKASN